MKARDTIKVAAAVVVAGLIRLTKWTAPRPVTKHLRLAADGTVEKVSTAAQLYTGKVTRLECTPASFVKALANIGPNDCLSYGVPVDDFATKVMSMKSFAALNMPPNALTRTKEAMTWSSGPGLLMIDHDPGDRSYAPQELLDAIYAFCPALRTTAHIWNSSASSCLRNTVTKKEVRGIEGQRVYIVVADATDIPRAGDVLFKRSWLAGQGHIKISKAGWLLVRSVLDASVFQPNRIDYCAPAICESPLAQRKPLPKLHGNQSLVLDTRLALSDLSAAELTKYYLLVASAKAQQQAAAAGIRASYIQQRVDVHVANGMDSAIALKIVSTAMDRKVLHANFILTTEDGLTVTVGQLLADKNTWHGKRFADPVEPDYHDDFRVARAYLDGPGRPYIHSFAHGGQRYLLSHAVVTIRLITGDRSQFMPQMVRVFDEQGTFYRRGEALVAIADEF